MFEPRLRFGVELEFSNNHIGDADLRGAVHQALSEHGDTAGLSRNETPDQWTLKEDCSCGFELTTPILEGQDELQRLGKIVKSIQGKFKGRNLVDNRCGLHVHFDVNTLARQDLQKVFSAFKKLENFIWGMVPHVRQESGYCHAIGRFSNSYDEFAMDHYMAVNFGCWSSRGSMEVRYGSGTCSEKKLVGWISFLQGLIGLALEKDCPAQNISTLEAFWSWAGEPAQTDWDARVVAWMNSRYLYLKEHAPGRNRQNYSLARGFRDQMDRMHRDYHYQLRREMTRARRREHDAQMIEWSGKGEEMLAHPLPEDFVSEWTQQNGSPEGDLEDATLEEEEIREEEVREDA